MTTRSWSLPAVAVLLAGTVPAAAELPPQYTVWQDFAAVATLAAIPDVLGVVDRIERADAGKYVVRAGSCFVEVQVRREARARAQRRGDRRALPDRRRQGRRAPLQLGSRRAM